MQCRLGAWQGRAPGCCQGGASICSSQGKCHEGNAGARKDGICGLRERLSIGMLAAVSPAFSLQPPTHSLRVTPASSELPSPHQNQGECLQARFCVLPLEEDTWVSIISHLTQAEGIPTRFHCPMLWGLYFLALVLWAVEPGRG